MSESNNSTLIVQPPPPPNLARPAEHKALAPQVGACPELSKALSAARDRCKTAVKSSRNEFHRYDYSSADTVIETAGDALDGSGLALIPIHQELTVLGSGAGAIHVLNRTFVLSHQSGEVVPIEVRGWPVVPDKGRPLDKAFATALTGSLAYALRDLLQIPRGKTDDMSARDDREAPVAPAAAQPAARSAPRHAKQDAPPAGTIGNPPPADGKELYKRLGVSDDAMAKDGLIGPGDLFDAVLEAGKHYGLGDDMEKWTADAIPLALQVRRAFIAARKAPGATITKHQCEILERLLEKKGETVARVNAKIERAAGAPLETMTCPQYVTICRALKEMQDRAA